MYKNISVSALVKKSSHSLTINICFTMTFSIGPPPLEISYIRVLNLVNNMYKALKLVKEILFLYNLLLKLLLSYTIDVPSTSSLIPLPYLFMEHYIVIIIELVFLGNFSPSILCILHMLYLILCHLFIYDF